MAYQLLNKTNLVRNSSECCKSLNQYSSDEELAKELVFVGYPDELLIFSAACCFIFMILGIPGNIVTIVALSKYRKIRNATAVFIINLSVSDLLFACIILPLSILLFLNKSWVTGKAMCLMFPILNYTLNAASVFSIAAITINRYVMVSHPLYYPKMYQTRNLIIMIIAIWVGAFSMLVPTLLEIWGRFSLDPKVGFCTIVPDENKESPKTAIIVMGFVFPCFCIVACYGRIMYLVRKSATKCRHRPCRTSKAKTDSTVKNQETSSGDTTPSGSTQEDENCDNVESPGRLTNFKNNLRATFKQRPRRISTTPTRRDKRLQAMIVAIIISFFACHLPVMIVQIVSKEFTLIEHYANITGYMLLYMTVCSNPIIYVVMSKEYRQAYTSVFGFLWKR